MLDQYVKRTLKCRWYVRYVDDLVLLSHDPAELRRWEAEIEEFLDTRLRLRLRAERREPVPVGHGVDFVGWRTWWNRRIPRPGAVRRLRRRIVETQRSHVRRAFGGAGVRIEVPLEPPPTTRGAARVRRRGGEIAALTRSLASYAGHLRHGQAWRAWARMWEAHPWLLGLFRRQGWTVAARWGTRPRPADGSYPARYRALLPRAGEDLLLFQRVGRYVEFHGPQRVLAQRLLGLRAAWLPRAGYAFTAGFPVWRAARFAERAVRAGMGVAIVRRWEPGMGRPAITLVWPVRRRAHLGDVELNQAR